MGILIRRVVIPLAILAGLFFSANIVASNVAADRIAQAAQSSFDLAEKPVVKLEGFPIIVNALTGNLRGLSFRAGNVTIEGLSFREVVVRMEDLRADGGLLRSSGLRVVIGRGEVRAEATDEAVNAFLEEQDQDATIEFRENGEAVVRTTQRIAGRNRRIVAVGVVELDEAKQRLRFTAERVTVDGDQPPAALRREAERRSQLIIDLPRLPGNLRITTIQTAQGVVALAAVLENFEFPPAEGEDLENDSA